MKSSEQNRNTGREKIPPQGQHEPHITYIILLKQTTARLTRDNIRSAHKHKYTHTHKHAHCYCEEHI